MRTIETEQNRSKQNTTCTTMRTIETEQNRSKQNTTCTTMRSIETEQNRFKLKHYMYYDENKRNRTDQI